MKGKICEKRRRRLKTKDNNEFHKERQELKTTGREVVKEYEEEDRLKRTVGKEDDGEGYRSRRRSVVCVDGALLWR